MDKIEGHAKKIRDLLANAKFSIDYYQREYRWEKKHVVELIEDLTGKFKDSYNPDHLREDVQRYSHYFLGSVIISNDGGQKFVIDGQQRLTSITLLLILLHRQLAIPDDKAQLSQLIFSQQYGKRSFNLDVPDRAQFMDSLFNDKPFDDDGQNESISNMWERFQDIEDTLSDEIDDSEILPYFTDWLIENAYFVEITAHSDADAYTIFETMNDRGLSLTPSEMLKGYLLSNITSRDDRHKANSIWKECVSSLTELGKDEDADAIKAWLRSQHAVSIRERKRGAQPRDFDLIGTEFHRWVRDNESNLNLRESRSFFNLILEDFSFYSERYRQIRRAEETVTPGLEAVYRNAQNNFTLQRPALLAPLHPDDSEEKIRSKLRIVAAFIDIMITRRVWNWHAIDYSTMQYRMFQDIIRSIRGKEILELAQILSGRLEAYPEKFDQNGFYLHQQNRKKVHNMLARMTDFIEIESGMTDKADSNYSKYIQRGMENSFEIEHIWADHPERHTDEFSDTNEFNLYRNRIGGLILLPKSFNASLGDMPYSEKRKHYNSQNLLARSLVEQAYSHNPGFLKFVDKSELPFRHHAEFKRSDLDSRQELYRQLADFIWNPKILFEEANS